MSVAIVWDPQEQVAALYDSVSGVAFGEVFTGEESYEDAEHFLAFLDRKSLDARAVQPNTLRELRREFAEAEEPPPAPTIRVMKGNAA